MKPTTIPQALSRRSRPLSWVAIAAIGGAALIALLLATPKLDVSHPNPAQNALPKAARLSVDQETIDFGDVKLGKTVAAVFRLTNTGGQPIRVTEKPAVELLEGC